MRSGLLALSVLISVAAADPQTPPLRSTLRAYDIEGDAINASLTGQAGDAARGALLLQQRQKSLCLLCHSGPFPEPHLQGTIAPDLRGIGDRLSEGQLRLRIVDMKRLNPDSIMPAYYAVAANSSASRIAPDWRDRPILNADEIEDLVAYLRTLKQ
jgi:L-cysteine S-thiosulfotransferase